MIQFLKEQGVQQQMQHNPYDSDGDRVPNHLDKWPDRDDRIAKREAILHNPAQSGQ